jgi:hypothetical protein
MATAANTNAELKVGGTDLTGFAQNATLSRSVNTSDVTTLDSSATEYIPTLADGTLSIDGPYTASIYSHLRGLEGTVTAFEFFPLGNSAGNPKESGSCIVTSVETAASSGEAVMLTVELQITGSVTAGTV